MVAVNRKFLVSFAIVVLACMYFGSAQSAQADSLLVAPNGDTAANGNAGTIIPFAEGAAAITFQWDLAGSQLTPMIGDTINAIGFRLLTGSSNVPGPTTIGTFDLQLSSSLNPI